MDDHESKRWKEEGRTVNDPQKEKKEEIQHGLETKNDDTNAYLYDVSIIVQLLNLVFYELDSCS